MASSPVFKVYDAHKKYQAACKEAEAAACLAALYGHGATVRYQHSNILWTEGVDGAASESYDSAARTMLTRINELQRKAYNLAYGDVSAGKVSP